MGTLPIDRIIRSSRKTIALEITRDARLIVRAPMRMPVPAIWDVVLEKREWIEKKLAEAALRPQVPEPEFVTGDEFLFLGLPRRLEVREDCEIPAIEGNRIVIPAGSRKGREAHLKAWFRSEADRIIPARSAVFSEITGLVPASVRITDASHRWGSCSSERRINFSWRLVMAPAHVIDYVVVHEIVHLQHHNHSKQFWDRVGDFVPEYKKHRKWLIDHQRILLGWGQ